jgi:hypothetical protein
MKIQTIHSMLIVLALSLLTACATYPQPTQRSGPVMGSVVVSGGSNQRTSQSSRITAAEARRLAVANGLTGYKSLPPGIAKNLARGKPLPPGIARTRVPGGMLNSLPQIEGHEWQISGRDLILIAIGTLIVVEVLQNVFE